VIAPILFPDIPEEGPRIFSPAAINAAGFFVGGPLPAIPGGLLRLLEEAKSEEQRNADLMTALVNDAPAKRATRAEKRKARKRAELEAAMACRRAVMSEQAA
jgi:hypothetical protein